jgi:hypothetical protein
MSDDDFGVTKDAREDIFQLGLPSALTEALRQTCAALPWPPREIPNVEGMIRGTQCGWHRPGAGILVEHIIVYRQATRADGHVLPRHIRIVVARILTNEQLTSCAPPDVVTQLADEADGPQGVYGNGRTASGPVVRLWQAILLRLRRLRPQRSTSGSRGAF